MRFIYSICRYFVGILFIFSGGIKINDPIGTQIKLQEYFEVFSSDFSPIFEIFIPYALILSVLLCTLEIVIGFALLLNYKIQIVSKITLGLIIFFTFLTFYSAYFNKVTDCGCFGDAIKLTPWESFIKDIILLILSGAIFYIHPKLENKRGFLYLKFFDDKVIRNGVIISVTIICILVSYTAINFLPFIDFRSYKIGNYIPELMEPSDELRYSYVMEKNDKIYEFDTYPQDNSYNFVELKLLNPEAEPKITDYNLWNDEGDYTKESFLGNKLFLIVHDFQNLDIDENKIDKFISKMKNLENGINFWVETVIVTSSDENTVNSFKEKYGIDNKIVYGDATVLKTIIRSNPGFFLMRNGTVKGKWHFNSFPEPKEILRGVNITI